MLMYSLESMANLNHSRIAALSSQGLGTRFKEGEAAEVDAVLAVGEQIGRLNSWRLFVVAI